MTEVERAARAAWPSPEMTPLERARLVARYGRRFAVGETLVVEGMPARESFVVREGRVRLLRRAAMADRSLAILGAGDVFGEGALMDQATYGATAVALTDGALLALDRGTLQALLEDHPKGAAQILEQMAKRLRDAEDQLEIMLLRGVQSKVTSALLKLVGGAASGAASVVISPVELSSRVGLDVDAVRRTVQRLRDRHYLLIRGERIEIPDVEALRKLALLLGTKDELSGASALLG